MSFQLCIPLLFYLNWLIILHFPLKISCPFMRIHSWNMLVEMISLQMTDQYYFKYFNHHLHLMRDYAIKKAPCFHKSIMLGHLCSCSSWNYQYLQIFFYLRRFVNLLLERNLHLQIISCYVNIQIAHFHYNLLFFDVDLVALKKYQRFCCFRVILNITMCNLMKLWKNVRLVWKYHFLHIVLKCQIENMICTEVRMYFLQRIAISKNQCAQCSMQAINLTDTQVEGHYYHLQLGEFFLLFLFLRDPSFSLFEFSKGIFPKKY